MMINGFHSRYFVSCDKTQLHYMINFNPSQARNRPVLTFNYGLVCSFLHFKPQVEFFHQQGFPIILHDYRAHFKSGGKDRIDQITISLLADDIYDLLKMLQIPKTIMIGHSMGVNITLEFIKKYPRIVPASVLMSGTVLDVTNVLMGSRISGHIFPLLSFLDKNYPHFLKKLWSLTNHNSIVIQIIRFAGFNFKKVNTQFVKEYMEKIDQLGHQLFLQLFSQMRKQNILPFLPQMKIPQLLLYGDRDKVIPPETQKELGKLLPNATIKVIRRGSHVPQIDFPNIVNTQILNFVEAHFQSHKEDFISHFHSFDS